MYLSNANVHFKFTQLAAPLLHGADETPERVARRRRERHRKRGWVEIRGVRVRGWTRQTGRRGKGRASRVT